MPPSNLHFSISERKLYLRFMDMLFVLAGLFIISHFYNFQYFSFSNDQSILWVAILVGYLLFFGEIFEMYQLKVASDVYLTLRSTFITVAFTTLFYVFTPFISPVLPQNRFQILLFIGSLLISILLNRFLYIQLIFSPRFFKNILIIGNVHEIEPILLTMQHNGSHKIVAYVSTEKIENSEDLKFININDARLEQAISENYIHEIVVSANHTHFIPKKINNQLIKLFEKGVIIKSLDAFLEGETKHISVAQLKEDFYTNFTFSKNQQNNLYLVFRRLLDILFSVIGIIGFLLLIPVVLLGNLLGNRGKLLYIQQRVGYKGVQFKIIKFRTMVSNAEKNGVEWAQKNDARITPFGRILRKTRLDEVPQFLNVLKGEMSLIGPRPERPEFMEQLRNDIPFYAIRHVIRPGLTGWAQVMHPYASTVEDQHKKLLYDLYYIKERNLLLDFRIVMKTISTILFFRGT